MKKLRSNIIIVILALVLCFSMTVSSFAANFTVPTSPKKTGVEDNTLTTSAMRAGQIAPLMLGANLVSTSFLGASRGDYNKVNSILGVFGSDVNEVPDPYLYNYFYNLNATANGKSTVKNATINVEQEDGTPQTADAISDVLINRPHLILSQGPGMGNSQVSKGYGDIIAALPENTDADKTNDYTPDFYTCSISSLVYQSDNLINLGKVMDQMCKANNLTTRYKDSPYVIGSDYDKYIWGYYFYIQSQLKEKNIAKKSVAVVSKTEDNGATWTMPQKATEVSASKPNRLVEYCRDNTDLLSDKLGDNASLTQVLDNDVIVAIGNGNVIRSAAENIGVKEENMPIIIDTLPTCLFGMTMQTHENALGIPYIQSIIYGDQIDLNPAYAAAYFYQKFFHITDNYALQETANTLLANATLSKGVTTDLSDYDPKAVEKLIIKGIKYSTANNLKRHDDINAWAPDMKVGIGASKTEVVEDVITNKDLPFTDVSKDAWYYSSVKSAYENKLFGGTSATKFEPSLKMNRAMFVTVLYNMANKPAVSSQSSFTDLSQDWYKDAVVWASEKGITGGTSETTFSPNNQVTREQMAVFLANYNKKVLGKDITKSGELNSFRDISQISSWAEESMSWAVGEGLIAGTPKSDGTYLVPKDSATRAQAAKVLTSFLK